MEITWYESLFYGFLSGLTEILPLSSQAHQSLLKLFLGKSVHGVVQAAVHLGTALALIFSCMTILSRLKRERRIAAIPPRKRKRQPDARSILELRLLKTAVIPFLICFLLYPIISQLQQRLWLLALLTAVNGIALYVPQCLYRGNKDAQSLSALDAFLIGLSGGIGILPGISGIGFAVSTGLVRGADRHFLLDMVLVLLIPVMLVWMFVDIVGIFSAASAVTFVHVICGICAFLASFAGAAVGVLVMRFLAYKAGYSGFAYYCWGLALLTFFLYLI